MARCTVCDLPTKPAIDRALIVNETSITALAKRHGVSRQALLRHKAAHLPQALLDAHALGADDRGSALLDDIAAMRGHVTELLLAAKAKGDVRGATTAVREATRLIELIARVTGDLTPPPVVQINLTQTPEFRDVAHRILTALDAYPVARAAVVAALQANAP